MISLRHDLTNITTSKCLIWDRLSTEYRNYFQDVALRIIKKKWTKDMGQLVGAVKAQ